MKLKAVWLGVVALMGCGARVPSASAPPEAAAPQPAASARIGPASSQPAQEAEAQASPEKVSCDEIAAVADAAPGLLEQGLRAWLGEGVAQNATKARALLARACEPSDGSEKDPAACAALGVFHETGDGAAKDIKKAIAIYESAVSSPRSFDLNACELAAPALTKGITSWSTMCCRAVRGCKEGCEETCARGLARVKEGTIAVLERACDRGRAAACFLAARQYAYGSFKEPLGYVVEGDSARAQRLNELACQGGVGRACTDLGMHAEVRDDPEKDPKAAARVMELFFKGCKLGDGSGCVYAAEKVKDGWASLTKDPVAADKLYKQACSFGMRRVCEDLEAKKP